MLREFIVECFRVLMRCTVCMSVCVHLSVYVFMLTLAALWLPHTLLHGEGDVKLIICIKNVKNL